MRHTIASGSGFSPLPTMTVLPPVPPTPGLALHRIIPPASSRDIALVWSRTPPRAVTLETLAPTLIPPIALVRELRVGRPVEPPGIVPARDNPRG